jgi:glutamate racemase
VHKFTPKASDPIGIFDSGIGGLTVAKAIHDLLPSENLVYFGDTAHMPYGEKSPHAIKSYSERIATFLIEQPCKLVVIACNSASVTAFKQVQQILPDKQFVINVIDPVVEYMVSENTYQRIGLIGTKRTVSSAVYKKKFEKANPDIVLKSLATPLLAPMVEEGFFNNNISKTVVHSYLSNPHLAHIEAIILACTHYPLIINEISSFYKGKVKIINSAEIVSKAVSDFLDAKKLANKQKKESKHRFYVSDYTESFEEAAKIFFGGKIRLKEKNLWLEEK